MTTKIPELVQVVTPAFDIDYGIEKKGILARDVVANPRYATLFQDLYSTLRHGKIANCRIKNRGEGNWTGTVVDYRDNNMVYGVEGPIKIIDAHKFEAIEKCPEPRVGLIELPGDGYGIPTIFRPFGVKGTKPDLNRTLADLRENFGFWRKTTQDIKESQDAYKALGLKTGLASKQWRRSCGKHGLVPVNRYSVDGGGPLNVDAIWYFDFFDDGNPFFGALPVSG